MCWLLYIVWDMTLLVLSTSVYIYIYLNILFTFKILPIAVIFAAPWFMNCFFFLHFFTGFLHFSLYLLFCSLLLFLFVTILLLPLWISSCKSCLQSPISNFWFPCITLYDSIFPFVAHRTHLFLSISSNTLQFQNTHFSPSYTSSGFLGTCFFV